MKRIRRDVYTVASAVMRALDTPTSLGVYLQMKYGEWDDVVGRTIDPLHYLDCTIGAAKFARDYQAISLLRKYPGLPVTKADCYQSFYESEQECCRTNARLDLLWYPMGQPTGLLKFLNRVRKICRSILGPLPDTLDGRFGPGTCFEFTGRQYASPASKTIGAKIRHQLTLTESAIPIVENVLYRTHYGEAISRQGRASRIVRGNRFTTVPKDARKDRGICVEPGGNLFAQLGAGSYLRHRLKRVAGIDLNHGQALHQRLAKRGSITGDLVTIDLSSASDTVSTNLVGLFLDSSPEWLSLLRSLRSPMTRVKGKWVHLEKFSSMGNGFTFELETMLFLAIALAASRRELGDPEVKVYGDDIIVPSSSAADVLSALRFFGFTPNPRKTFTTGPFRESCGGDYFDGWNVTPFYLKKIPTNAPEWVALCNGLYRIPYLRWVSLLARRFIGEPVPTGPQRLGDLVLHDRWYKTRTRRGFCRQIRWVRTLEPVPVRRYSVYRYGRDIALALAVYGVASSGEVPQNGDIRYRRGWASVS